MKKNTVACILFLTYICLSFSTFAEDSASPDRDGNIRGLSVDLGHGDAPKHNQEPSNNPYVAEKVERSTTTDDDEVASSKKTKAYKVWVTLINPAIKVEGYLYDWNDSTIVVTSTKEHINDQSSQMISNRELLVSNISKIKLRKTRSIGKGYLIGTSIGVGTGIILGTIGAEGDGFAIFASAGMLGILGSIVGTTVGLISGSKTYNIGGSLDTYRMYKSKLKASSMVKD
jgi:hypothetical protein